MSRPFTLLIKPTGPDCNLACRYCFYAGKTCLFGTGSHRMSREVQEHLVKSYLNLRFPISAFAWQGGEPTLMGLDFYKQLVAFQKRYGSPGQMVSNALQTNGILLDEPWCKFLAENHFLVGVSLDGPKELHDYYRLDHAGNGTWDRVMMGISNCRKYGVEFNILVLLNDKNVKHPDLLFDFFTSQNIQFLQFIQCVEKDPATGMPAEYSIAPEEYGDFLCRIFDRWLDLGPTKLSIRIFDSLLSYILGRGPTECTFGPYCSDYIVIEHNGDAFCCDFYVEQSARLGNIMETPIERLAASPVKREFAYAKAKLDNTCLICRYLDICRGGCPKDRRVMTGKTNVPSYFCAGYKKFFAHAMPKLRELAAKLPRSAKS
jgi:uncharacterized protein